MALGSDFDGATMPQDLRDAAGLPKLMDALREYGFSEADLEKIAHKNSAACAAGDVEVEQ
ncbi:MAG: membrane dipeptidase [Caldilineaceae bacterium]